MKFTRDEYVSSREAGRIVKNGIEMPFGALLGTQVNQFRFAGSRADLYRSEQGEYSLHGWVRWVYGEEREGLESGYRALTSEEAAELLRE